MTENKTMNISKAPTYTGTVMSNRMKNTIVVKVDTLKTHPKYKKQYRASKRYKVETMGKEFAIGDSVMFRECRPISRDKRHIIVTE